MSRFWAATTLPGVSVEVRTLRPEELVPWVECMYTAFHGNRTAQEVAAYRAQVLPQDYTRTLAAVDGQHVVGTYESFAAELSLPGGVCLPANAISAVSVLPSHRRRGLLRRMLDLDLGNAHERGEAVSILQASEYPIYGRFGFGPATERAEYAIDPSRARFSRAAVGQVEVVSPAGLRELAPPLFDRFRRTRPGQIDRETHSWDTRLGLRDAPWSRRDRVVRCATYSNPAHELEGYLIYSAESANRRTGPRSKIEVAELIALTSDAYLGLWRYACELDLVTEIMAGHRCVDEALPWLLDNPRDAVQMTMRHDYLWVRPMDVPRLLSTRRYASPERVVLEVSDPLGSCGGRFLLEAEPDGASCRPTEQSADLQMGMTALGAISLGGVNLHLLAEAGLIEELGAGALDRAERLFRWPITPWCSTNF
jgi:predicted acetyltransferase